MNRTWSVVILLGGLFASHSATARELSEIVKSKELRACFVAKYDGLFAPVPRDCKDSCSPSSGGAAVEFMRAFANHLSPDVKLMIRQITFDEQFASDHIADGRKSAGEPVILSSGKCDILPNNVTILERRSSQMAFVPLFRSRAIVLTDKSKYRYFIRPQDLAGKTLVTHKGSAFESWVQEMNLVAFKENPVKMHIEPRTEGQLAALSTGKADFVLFDSDTAVWLAKDKQHSYRVTFPVGKSDEIGWAIAKSSVNLKAEIEKFLYPNGKRNKLMNRIWKEHYGLTFAEFELLVRGGN